MEKSFSLHNIHGDNLHLKINCMLKLKQFVAHFEQLHIQKALFHTLLLNPITDNILATFAMTT